MLQYEVPFKALYELSTSGMLSCLAGGFVCTLQLKPLIQLNQLRRREECFSSLPAFDSNRHDGKSLDKLET